MMFSAAIEVNPSMTYCNPPTISIVIPTMNNSNTICALFKSIEKQGLRDYEIIVVDAFSTDDTAEIALKNGAIIRQEMLRRSAARNLGARIASSDVLLFLDSDMELTENVLSKCLAMIESNDALCIREKVVGVNYWARARALERDGFFHSLYFEAARCFNRRIFLELGGYDTRLDGYEDLDIQGRLIESKLRIGWVDAVILHHEGDIGFREYLKKRRVYSRGLEIYKSKHPEISKILFSPFKRIECVMLELKKNSTVKNIFLLPGLVTMRLIEYMFSSF